MRRRLAPTLLSSALALGVFACGGQAHADVSSWLALGGGYALEHDVQNDATSDAGLFSASIGVGTTPRAHWVVGGIFRTSTYVGLGTDLSIGPRFATGGFARGDWGVAVDLGMVGRFWNRGDYGRFPVQGVVTLGGPWGLGLALGAQLGDVGSSKLARGGFVALEVDLLRLTVMRQGSTDAYWLNPSPAGGRGEDSE